MKTLPFITTAAIASPRAGIPGTLRNDSNKSWRAACVASAAAALVLLAGCAVTPQPFTAAERAAQVAADRAVLYLDQAPVTGPITLEEAVARALKYNLDGRVALMEQAVKLRQLDLSRYDLLPRLVADAGYYIRDKEQLSTSRDVAGNLTDPDSASTSLEKRRLVTELELSWNVLDFGLSYYQAKQNADLLLIAEEQRRRAVHAIVQQVRASFWRAAAAQRLDAVIRPVLADARQALGDAQTVEQERLRPLIETLRYQRTLVGAVRQLSRLEEDLAIAKAELARLMNLPPGTEYELAVPLAAEVSVPEVGLSVEEMETLALQNRPELREVAYQGRVTALQARKEILRLFPNLNLYGSINADTNDYLVHQDWAEAGARVSWNLLNVLSLPANRRLREARQELDETRRLALSMAVLAQTHVGYQQFLRAREQYQQAAQLSGIEARIFQTVSTAAAGEAQSVLERVQAGTAAAAAEFERDLAFAELQNAYAALSTSLGLDPLPDAVTSHDLSTVAASLRTSLEDQLAAPGATTSSSGVASPGAGAR